MYWHERISRHQKNQRKSPQIGTGVDIEAGQPGQLLPEQRKIRRSRLPKSTIRPQLAAPWRDSVFSSRKGSIIASAGSLAAQRAEMPGSSYPTRAVQRDLPGAGLQAGRSLPYRVNAAEADAQTLPPPGGAARPDPTPAPPSACPSPGPPPRVRSHGRIPAPSIFDGTRSGRRNFPKILRIRVSAPIAAAAPENGGPGP